MHGLNQGNRNASDGIALMQTMEGGMDEISNMLQRIRTLAVQSANGTMTSDDRAAIDKEAAALSEEIDRIAEQTTYGGKTILSGQGTNPNSNSIFSAGTAASHKVGTHTAGTGTFQLQVGANQGNTLEFDVNSFAMLDLFAKAGFGTYGQGETAAANLISMTAGGKGLGFIVSAAGTAANADVTGIRFDLSTQAQAEAAITAVDKILNIVDSQRSNLGAAQNRLESSIRNQSNVATNSSDARSRIRDTDFATESAALSQQNIIQQAATSMLMQANMRPQLGLSLLG